METEKTLHGQRVLIIEDDPQVSTLVQRLAERLGATTLAIASSREFMRSVVLFKPDIIVLDLVMRHFDGFEILQWLSDIDYRGRLLAISGDGKYLALMMTLAAAKCGGMKAAGLSKPFQIAELQAALTGQIPLMETAGDRVATITNASTRGLGGPTNVGSA